MEFIERGICRLCLVPVKATDSDKSELVTQLLFGDHYTVLEKSSNEKWVKIRIYFDDYEGWIDIKQHHWISEEYFDQINYSEYKICTDVISSILFKKQYLNIVIGSILPIASNELFKIEEHLAFNGSAKNLYQKRDFDFLKNIAFKYINAPYLWGGKSPFGIDCSGFTQQVYKICGYQIKRDARQQSTQGVTVTDIEHAKPGDLAFFEDSEGKVVHVGIILNENKIIHASGKVRVDLIDEKGIYNEETNAYTHKLTLMKRFLKSEILRGR